MAFLAGVAMACALHAAGVAGTASSEQAQAKQILAATGVAGGLIVHLGCGDGKLTAALRVNDSYVVHGLDRDAANVAAARKHIQSLGLYGPVSVDQLRGTHLPYAENLVDLVFAESLGDVPMAEVMRVLAPRGVAYVGGRKTVKPRPKEIAEWTHYLYDASNNAVAPDSVVGPPRRLQWIVSLSWARHHDHMASTSAMVSANGRLFYIFDKGSTASIVLPSHWWLIARDAFNGTVLWKRPIAKWFTQLWPLKSGPALLTRRLVAVGDEVYVTLGLDAPLTVLAAATGELVPQPEGRIGGLYSLERGPTRFLINSDKYPQFRRHYSTEGYFGPYASGSQIIATFPEAKEAIPCVACAFAGTDAVVLQGNKGEGVLRRYDTRKLSGRDAARSDRTPAWSRVVDGDWRAQEKGQRLYHYSSLIVAGDMVVVAGRIKGRAHQSDPVPGMRDVAEGVIKTFDLRTGEPRQTLELDAAPVVSGLAAAGGRLYVTCEDGSLRSFTAGR